MKHSYFYFVPIVLICLACTPQPEGDSVGFVRTESGRALTDVVKHTEWIPLQTEGVPIIGPSPELYVLSDGSFIVWDKKKPAVYHFGADGAYIGPIGRSGSGPGEYLDIKNIQILDNQVMVFSYPDKVLVYDMSGAFSSESHIEDSGTQSFRVPEGYLTYYGFGSGRGYRAALLTESGMTTFLTDQAKVIHLSTGNPVFLQSGSDIYFTDAYSPVIYAYSQGKVSPYVRFDFGRSAISPKFYEFEDAFGAMEFLLSSEFALIERFIGGEPGRMVEVFIQKGEEVRVYYGMNFNEQEKWDWFGAGQLGKDPFAGAFRYMGDNAIYCIIDAWMLEEKKGHGLFHCPLSVRAEQNPIIAKLYLK